MQGTGSCPPSIERQLQYWAGRAQVHTLLKGLEKIAASADIPMLVAGDFNSVPGSAAHSLLVKQSVDPGHPVRCYPSPGGFAMHGLCGRPSVTVG